MFEGNGLKISTNPVANRSARKQSTVYLATDRVRLFRVKEEVEGDASDAVECE